MQAGRERPNQTLVVSIGGEPSTRYGVARRRPLFASADRGVRGGSVIPLYLLVFIGSLVSCALAIWLLGRLAPHVDLVDRPSGRKEHLDSTPLIGGVAIIISSALVLSISMVAFGFAEGFLLSLWQHKGFFAGAALLAVLGVIDDRKPIAARWKLLVQGLAAALAVFGDGVVIGDVGLDVGPFEFVLGPLVWPFTLVVMLTIINAINMIDGIDGLAGGICLAILLLMSKAVITAGFGAAPYLLALAGALAAFLMVNFPWRPGHKAHAFLGDAGSLVFGFTLAYLAISFSALPNRVFKPSTALWFFFIPVADTVWLFIRRTLIARAPFMPGRDHIHHLLMQHFTAAQTSWILVGASAAIAGGAYWAGRFGFNGPLVILVWIGAFLAYGALTHHAWKRAWARSQAYRDAEASAP